jgi:hypothetical protein
MGHLSQRISSVTWTIQLGRLVLTPESKGHGKYEWYTMFIAPVSIQGEGALPWTDEALRGIETAPRGIAAAVRGSDAALRKNVGASAARTLTD